MIAHNLLECSFFAVDVHRELPQISGLSPIAWRSLPEIVSIRHALGPYVVVMPRLV